MAKLRLKLLMESPLLVEVKQHVGALVPGWLPILLGLITNAKVICDKWVECIAASLSNFQSCSSAVPSSKKLVDRTVPYSKTLKKCSRVSLRKVRFRCLRRNEISS